MSSRKLLILLLDVMVLICLIPFIQSIKKSDSDLIDHSKMLVPSKESGWYKDPFELELHTEEQGAEIFYTLDGSKPTRESLQYMGAIQIRESDDLIVVRAGMFHKNIESDSEYVFTYLIGNEKLKYMKIPVLEVTVNPEDLFDPETGIYVKGNLAEKYPDLLVPKLEEANYNLEGEVVEREAHIEAFDVWGQSFYAENATISIRGGVNRAGDAKGFRLSASDKNMGLNFPDIFGNSGMEIQAIGLIHEGNDPQIKNIFANKLAENLNVGIRNVYPCNLFLNGKFWGMYYICERLDEDYFYRHFNANMLDLIEVKMTRGEEEIQGNSVYGQKAYGQLKEWVENHDLSKTENMDRFASYVDLDSLLDYYCFEVYIGNSDWITNNYEMWRTICSTDDRYNDGKWRFILYDTDLIECMNIEDVTYNTFERIDDKDWLLPKLLENTTFRIMFATKMRDMENIIFTQDHVDEVLKEVYSLTNESIVLDHLRWKNSLNYDLKSNLEEDTQDFFYVRPEYIRKYTEQRLGIDKELVSLAVIIDSDCMGKVSVNGLNIDLQYGSWEGKYYCDFPIKLSAETNEGYYFKGWKILSECDQQEYIMDKEIDFVMPESGMVIQAVFEKTR